MDLLPEDKPLSENGNSYQPDVSLPVVPQREVPHDVEFVEAPPAAFYTPPTPNYRRALILYVLTFLSTLLTGVIMSGQLYVEEGTSWPIFVKDWSELLYWGLGYSLGVMGILTFHELGHYLQARRYGVLASLPYFLPLPLLSPFGTLGAVIVQREGWRDRKILFDIAVTGPIAGLVLTFPVLLVGLMNSEYIPVPKGEGGGMVFGDPLVLKWMASYVLGPQLEGMEIKLTPLLFAGWVGLFVTALNLIPLGQLDGGHILYALLRRKAHYVAMGIVFLAAGYMGWAGDFTYMLLLGMVVWMGIKHPPTGNDYVELGSTRIMIGWLTLAFLFIGFTPVPIVSL